MLDVTKPCITPARFRSQEDYGYDGQTKKTALPQKKWSAKFRKLRGFQHDAVTLLLHHGSETSLVDCKCGTLKF
jgi:hypothetical protein